MGLRALLGCTHYDSVRVYLDPRRGGWVIGQRLCDHIGPGTRFLFGSQKWQYFSALTAFACSVSNWMLPTCHEKENCNSILNFFSAITGRWRHQPFLKFRDRVLSDFADATRSGCGASRQFNHMDVFLRRGRQGYQQVNQSSWVSQVLVYILHLKQQSF